MVTDSAGADTPKLSDLYRKLAQIVPDKSKRWRNAALEDSINATKGFGTIVHESMMDMMRMEQDEAIARRLHENAAALGAARFGSPTPAHMRPVSGHSAPLPASSPGAQTVNASNLLPGGRTFAVPKPVKNRRVKAGYVEESVVGWPRLSTDHLTVYDWTTLALEWRRMYPEPFGYVMSVPRSGDQFAACLSDYRTPGCKRAVFTIARVTRGTALTQYIEDQVVLETDDFVIAAGWAYRDFPIPVVAHTALIEARLRPVFWVPHYPKATGWGDTDDDE